MLTQSDTYTASDASARSDAELSLIVPVYRNEGNIPPLMAAVEKLNTELGDRLEVVFVIDGSPDGSGHAILAARKRVQFRSRVIFHSRNFGSLTAVRTGLEHARGSYFAVMAADLQEPPDLILRFFEILRSGEADIVFGQRAGRNDSALRDALSNCFWWLYRKLVMRDMPKGGVDIFGCNEEARQALLSISEPNSSILAQLFWIGFRRTFVPYVRLKREVGKSAWSFARRLRYMMDSILAFSDLPILIVLWVGVVGVAVSAIFGLVSLLGRLTGVIETQGYTTLVFLIAFFGSLTLLGNGLIGCYVWRTFENSKRRPLRIISRIVEQ